MSHFIRRSQAYSHRAFTLIEVTLSLGIVTLALVSILGTLPTAMAAGRQSISEGRAAAVADTIFASFRAQSFVRVCYLDAQLNADGYTAVAAPSPTPLNLSQQTATLSYYAAYNPPVSTSDAVNAATDQLGHLSLLAAPPANGTYYRVKLTFNPLPPDGLVAGQAPLSAYQANRIEMTLTAADRPTYAYRFTSTLASRSN